MLRIFTQNIYKFSKQLIQKSSNSTLLANKNEIKLSKWISMKSLCSRKQAQQFIKLGLVRIDGKRVYDNLMVPQNANMKAFTPQGIKIQKPITRLWMMNKPRGCICSHSDPQKRKSIYQLLPPQFKNYGYIMSVGRLDFNSQGLLLLTNDVKLKNLLQNPLSNMYRVYRVKVHGRVTQQKLLKMTKVLKINGQNYGPLQVKVDRQLNTNVWLNVAMKTGKNRQIRRIMQNCDLQVNKLIRQQYGKYKLNSLLHGEIKEVPISEGLERKLKLQKVKQLANNRKHLIQIDIRDQAIKLAQIQQKYKISANNQQLKYNKLTANPKNLQNMQKLTSMQKNGQQQQQSDIENENDIQ